MHDLAGEELAAEVLLHHEAVQIPASIGGGVRGPRPTLTV